MAPKLKIPTNERAKNASTDEQIEIKNASPIRANIEKVGLWAKVAKKDLGMML